jgi:DNA polymerase-3 subunit delta
MIKDFVKAEELFHSVKHSDQEVVLIFTLTTKKLLYSNHLVKFLLENSKVIEAKKPKEKDLVYLIKQMVEKKNAIISNKAALQLAVNLPNNLLIINNEINKLLLETNEISEKIIEASISKYNKRANFALSNAIVAGDAYDIIKAYYNELENGVDQLMIIGQLASNYSLAFLIHLYKKSGYSLSYISKKTGIHIFRINKLNQILNTQFSYSASQLLIKLAELDNNIKKGNIKKEQGLDMFIFYIVKNKITF